MAHGKSLEARYMQGKVFQVAHNPAWGPATRDDEKKMRKQEQQQARRSARARRQARA